jgi:hypothetical protein
MAASMAGHRAAEPDVVADDRGEGHQRHGRQGGGQRGDELAGQC